MDLSLYLSVTELKVDMYSVKERVYSQRAYNGFTKDCVGWGDWVYFIKLCV